ncbi:tetratricopeptide repeat protein [Oceanivirga salmonicida]|uniref:tetratricopeptide repeat protein n=1 Tax=Oceanivirga salmonicida TaxID=1769291 RepID=UPI00082999BD|nr:tetratricopeptide repeat protein [Oceanivirga salmonicida]
MKKIITLSALIISMITLAGPKADLEKAQKLLNERKEKEAIEVLKRSKMAKGEEAEYELINANIALYYLANKDEASAMKYFKKVSDDEKSRTDTSKSADGYLVQLSKNNKDKIKYLTRLSNRFDDKDLDILSSLAYLHITEKNTREVDKIFADAKKVKLDGFYDYLHLLTGQKLLVDDYNKADYYIKKALKSKDKSIVANTHFLLGVYHFDKKDMNKAKKELMEAEKLTPNDTNLLYRIANVYKALGDNNTSYEYLKKAYVKSRQEKQVILELIINSYKRKDTKDENKWVGVLRNLDKNFVDLALAEIFMQAGEIELAEKYALLAVKKDIDANFLLAYISIQKGDKKSAEKYATNSLKSKVFGEKAKQLLEEIKKIK